MNDPKPTTTWPELAVGLYDQLTGRNAEITYEFENFEVRVPSDASANAAQAPWRLNGALRIHTRDRDQA